MSFPRRLRLTPLLALALLVGRPRVAAARSAPDAVARFDASGEGCPDEATFRREAAARVPARRDPARSLQVRIGPAGAGYEATVQAVAGDQIVATRTVEGATCEDVARAALLLVALGSIEGAPPPDDAPAARPAATSAEVASRPPRPTLALHLGAAFLVMPGLGPVAAGGGLRAGASLEGRGWFRPELRAGFDVVGAGELTNEIGTASRRFFAGRLDACPIGLGPPALVVRLCAAGTLGRIGVRGEAVPQPRDESRLYAAAGGLLHARIRIAGALSADVAAGALAPLTRHRFFFDPDATLLVLDTTTFFGEIGLAWSIP